jgi:hypothetical protein
MGSEPLPQSFKTTAFESGGFQGILSIDRLLFKLDQEVRNDLYINIRASCIATCTVHIYSRESPLTTFSVADSLTFSTQAMGDTVAIFNYIPTSVIKDMAYDIGEQLSHRIIPSWSEEDRFLYAGSQARLAEALGFARKGHWSRAISLWLDEYERASAVETRAKMAANLAVAHEMLDQFQTALQWAATAQRHFAESGRASAAKARTAAHMAELNRRIKDNYLLDLQWGTPSEQ